jgi:hypothetical protein
MLLPIGADDECSSCAQPPRGARIAQLLVTAGDRLETRIAQAAVIINRRKLPGSRDVPDDSAGDALRIPAALIRSNPIPAAVSPV